MKYKFRPTGIVALFVTLCVAMMCLSPMAMAAKENDEIYYSDLFYGYSNEYLLSDYLSTYAISTSDVMWDLYEEYMNDGGSIWTTIASALGVAASPKQLFIYFADYFLDTEITYNNVLDAANAEFLFNMMDCSTTVSPEDLERTNSYCRVMSSVMGADELIEEACKDIVPTAPGSSKAAMWAVLNGAVDSGKFSSLSLTQVHELGGVLEEKFVERFEGAVNLMDAAKALYLSLVIEDVRLSMLDAIVMHAEEGSTLHEGMTRLRAQVIDGFEMYFINNYMTGQLIDDVIGLITKDYTPYKLATGLFDIAKTVIFDLALDIPDIDDLLKQTVLAEYSRDLYLATVKEVAVFYKPFDPNEVLVFEDLVTALMAATKAGLAATDPIAMSSNRDRLDDIIEEYKSITYAAYVADLKETLAAIDWKDREVKTYTEPWLIPENTVFDKATDDLQPNCIYMFEGVALGDYIAPHPITLCTVSGCPLVIEGKLTIQNCTVRAPEGQEITMQELTVHAGGTLQNEAELYCSQLTVTPAYNKHSIVRNYNKLSIEGDLTLNHDEDNYVFGWLYGMLCQSEPSACITVGGDIYAEKPDCFGLTEGLLLLNGNDAQHVTNLAAHNLMFDNPDGIEYGSDISVTGEFAPSRYADDERTHIIDNGHYVCLQPGGTVAQRSGTCGNIQLSGGTLPAPCTVDTLRIVQPSTLSGVTVTAADVIVDNTFTVAADAELLSQGELIVREREQLTINGVIQCEDLSVEAGPTYNTYVYNNGQFFVSDDMTLGYDSSYPANYGYFHQTEETAATYVGGDILAGSSGCFNVTAGEFELCGDEQQELTNLSVYNLTVSNPAGVRYLTDVTVSGTFSPNRSPLDCNGYYVWLKDGATLSDSTENHGRIYVRGTVSLGSATVDELYIRGKATVTTGEVLTVLQDVTMGSLGILVNNGTVHCENLLLPVNNNDCDVYNNGQLFVTEDIVLEDDGSYPAHTGCLHQTVAEAALYLGDQLHATYRRCWDVTAGTVNSQQVNRTITLIDAIGTVTIDREGAVAEARAAYAALHYLLQPYVTNYNLLTAAETALAPIVEAISALTFTASAQQQQVAVSVTSGKGELPTLTVLVCLYEQDGKFLSCTMLPIAPVKEGQTASVYATIPEDTSWKAMLVTPAGLRPLAECLSSEH